MPIYKDQDNYGIAEQYGVGAVWDEAAGAPRQIQRNSVWSVSDQWGNGGEIDPTVGGEYRRFHPGRDVKWDRSRAVNQIINLDNAGIFTVDSMFDGGRPDPTGLFAGDVGYQDFSNLIDVCHGPRSRQVLDIAPDLWVAQELIHQTGEIETEDRVELTAKRLLTWKNYNTWMNHYVFNRVERRGHGFSVPVDINDMSGIPTPRQSRQRKQIPRPLWHHMSGAQWSLLELEQMAEARANGAPDFNLVQEDTQEAQDDIARTENCLAYFGHEDLGIQGLLDNDEITKTAATTKLGAGSTPESDRLLFVDTACAIVEGSIRVQQADMILVGTKVWCYLNKTLYFDTTSGVSRTLLSVVMESLAPLGITKIEWAPEMEFRQAQATQLIEEHSFSAALANRWSGGLNQEHVIAFISSKAAFGTVGIGKVTAAQPQESFRGTVEARYLAASGGYDPRKPAAFHIKTDVI